MIDIHPRITPTHLIEIENLIIGGKILPQVVMDLIMNNIQEQKNNLSTETLMENVLIIVKLRPLTYL